LSGPGCNAAGIDHANEQAQIREIESHTPSKTDFLPSVNPKALSEKPHCASFWPDM
jgi:hypothetical protein